MRINTGERRLNLISWFKENFEEEFYSSLKLQKFLFFYEMFSKAHGEEYSLEYLKGYKNGPVFSEVYGDYTYRKDYLVEKISEKDSTLADSLNDEFAKKAAFLSSILTEEDLSEVTHQLDIWKSKESEINSERKHISLCEEDFSLADEALIHGLYDLYDSFTIENTERIEVGDYIFLLSKEDFSNLTDEQKITLQTLSESDVDLENPVYVEIGEEGELLID